MERGMFKRYDRNPILTADALPSKAYYILRSIYALFGAILDYKEPWKVVARSKYPRLFPETHYEREGRVANVVFTCNAIVEPDDTVKIYYGAADTCIGLAEARLGDIVEACYADYQYMLSTSLMEEK